ncbi:MAG: PAS domain S-box protein [Campylobacterota bacterium]|nr:PAS domain S-box protein [Campylobacterota bacterium]
MITTIPPTPVNRQIKLDKYKYIMSRTDVRGHIEYANDYFTKISGYNTKELIGANHNIIRHPDMPAIIFKLMWLRLKSGQHIHAVVKNLAKSGEHYWVTTKFDIKRHPFDNTIVGYLAYRQAARPNTIKIISDLYNKLLEIEQLNGVDASEKYLRGFLEEKQTTYDNFIDKAIENNSVMKMFFNTMSTFFKNK